MMDKPIPQFAGVSAPFTSFDATLNQLRARPFYVDIDLTNARAASAPLLLPIIGNFFYIDQRANTGSARIHFQDGTNGSTPVTVSAGFVAKVPFTQVWLENDAQAGQSIRIIFGTDIEFVPSLGALTLNGTLNAAGSIGILQQRASAGVAQLVVQPSGLDYSNAFTSTAALAANTPEQVVAPGANANGIELIAAHYYALLFNYYDKGTLLAKAGAAPANITDGDVLMQTQILFAGNVQMGGDLLRPLRIAAGKGLYFISAVAETANYSLRTALYRLL